jgi:nitrate reductase gamma subunit
MMGSSVLWTLFSLFLIGFSYAAAGVFLFGLIWRLLGYLRTPMPWPEVVTPAPTTEGGAIARVVGDVLVFPSLFKADKALWAGAWVFHISLAAVLFRHLRYFTYPVPALILFMEPVALTFGLLLGITLLYLFWRRLALPRTMYISNVPDYFVLALLGGVAGSGMLVSYWAHVYLVEVKAFLLGLLTLHPVAPPNHPLFLIHYVLVLLLMVYFPFSKLLHAGGIFFSPSRNAPFWVQKAGKRHLNRWDAPIR